MLNASDNDILTRVGPGTPMGELFRRFWLPAVLTEELADPGSPPVRLRILCEDLVAFRDTSGRVGIVEAYCSHRGAPLYFGRNEDCVLQCPYHGWKFNVDGACVEVPNAAGNARDNPQVREKFAIVAYPTHEAGGVVWVYMGPKEKKPPFPDFEWTRTPKGYCHASRWLQRSNWLQGAEGEIDTSHISFLHKDLDNGAKKITITGLQYAADGAPALSVKETDYGFLSGSRRTYEDKYFWRVTQWLAPMFSLIPRAPADDFTSGGGRAWVPVDDNNTTTFAYNFRVDRPLSQPELDLIHEGAHFPPRIRRASVQLAEGHRFDAYLPVAELENDYLMDRERQRTENFTGIWGVNEQDRSLQESLRSIGPRDRGIVDRSREHLVGSDLAIVTARRRLLRMAKDLQNGVEPGEVARGDIYAVRAVSKICDIADFDAFLETYRADAKAP